MRQIGSIQDPQQVEQFSSYLIAQGIACSVDATNTGHVIWVQSEDRVAEAKEELSRFLAEPNHERYRDATRRAVAAVRQKTQQAKEIRSRTVDMRDRWRRPTIDQGPVTFAVMALMIIVGVLTGMNAAKYPEFTLKLLFSPDGTWNAIFSGEVWRLVSPIFLHFGIMHFLFNLISLRDLGLMMEYRVGPSKYFGMVLVIAILSNIAQFVLSNGGPFGGMSGVNYGLFGYIWVRSRLDPESGLWIHPSTVTYLLGWYVLCFVGVIPNVANWAHAGGLIVGAAMGASTPMFKALMRK